MPTDKDGAGAWAAPVQPFKPLADANEFRLAAIHIFGTGWKGKTAQAFGVQGSTIYRWITEAIEIPHYALSAMAAWKIVFDLTKKVPPAAPEDKQPPTPKRHLANKRQ